MLLGMGNEPPAWKFAGAAVKRGQVRLGQAAGEVQRPQGLDRHEHVAVVDGGGQVAADLREGHCRGRSGARHLAGGRLTGRREVPARGLREGKTALDDAEVHADGAGGGAVHFRDRDHEHDLLFAGDAEEVDEVRRTGEDLLDGAKCRLLRRDWR